MQRTVYEDPDTLQQTISHDYIQAVDCLTMYPAALAKFEELRGAAVGYKCPKAEQITLQSQPGVESDSSIVNQQFIYLVNSCDSMKEIR